VDKVPGLFQRVAMFPKEDALAVGADFLLKHDRVVEA
jgi:hypothetical protein